MDENKKMIHENTENKPLTDQQLDKISGGDATVILKPVRRKICAADPSHIYLELDDACPICGSKEYIDIG